MIKHSASGQQYFAASVYPSDVFCSLGTTVVHHYQLRRIEQVRINRCACHEFPIDVKQKRTGRHIKKNDIIIVILDALEICSAT